MKLHSSNESGFLVSPEVSQSLHGLLPRQPSMLAPGGQEMVPTSPIGRNTQFSQRVTVTYAISQPNTSI